MFCVEIKGIYYYSTKAVVQRCSVNVKKSARSTGKHLCWSQFFNKVTSSVQLYYKRDSVTGWFPVTFAEVVRTTVLKNCRNWRDQRNTFSEANLAYLLRIKVPESLLKGFSELYCLNAVTLWHNDKNCR